MEFRAMVILRVKKKDKTRACCQTMASIVMQKSGFRDNNILKKKKSYSSVHLNLHSRKIPRFDRRKIWFGSVAKSVFFFMIIDTTKHQVNDL